MTNFLDSLVMLLSTDWFKPYWAAIGIQLDESRKELVQKGCREIVSQIVGEATEYWLTSFSDERRQVTRSMFESLAKAAGAEMAVVGALKEWSELSAEDLTAGWLFDSLTEELLSGDTKDRPIPGSEITTVIAMTREKQNFAQVDFEKLCVSSKSSWDRRIRQLTPDLPTYLSDALLNFLRARRFKALWTAIQSKLTPKQREELATWYRGAAKSRAQRDIAPSYVGDRWSSSLN